ncbi:hypothetical protein Tco_1247266 [Tanacetum coccineum]
MGPPVLCHDSKEMLFGASELLAHRASGLLVLTHGDKLVYLTLLERITFCKLRLIGSRGVSSDYPVILMIPKLQLNENSQSRRSAAAVESGHIVFTSKQFEQLMKNLPLFAQGHFKLPTNINDELDNDCVAGLDKKEGFKIGEKESWIVSFAQYPSSSDSYCYDFILCGDITELS